MSDLLPGTEVELRGLRWEVVFAQPAGEQHLYRLRCLAGGLRGRELDVLVPFENPRPIASALDPARAARLQEWRVFHDAFLLEQALGPSALLAAQPGRLRIKPYQLVPVMRALRMSRPRLLVADDVGLGKTIEAGLVLAELIARRRAHRVLIVSPAGPLLRQWQQEMRERFGMRFRILDADAVKQIRYENELGANTFDHVALGLISIDFAKQEKVIEEIERSHFDVVIVNEAHHCVSLGTAADREDSQRRKLAEVLARRADALLLLTATPHDGYDPHFASLVELLDPSLVDGKGALRGEGYKAHVVRRLKRHIKKDDGSDEFKERHVHPEAVPFDRGTTPRFAEFQEGLLALVAPQLKRALRKRAYGDVLAFISLLKRSVSTAAACASTLDVIAKRLGELAKEGAEGQEARRQRLRTLRDLVRRRERNGSLSFEEEQDLAALEAEDMAAELAEEGADELLVKLGSAERAARREHDRIKQITATRDGLAALARLAEKAAGEDPKLASLVAQIRAIREAEPGANVLVYTEYTDSQAAAVARLGAARDRGELAGEVIALSGEDPDAKRSAATEAFTTRDGLVLVSTDASAEGLNLHARCHHLIHLELPYNPNRLEQRNGRIDRFGQEHDPQIRYLYLAGSFEERLLARLVVKYEAQRKRLGFVPNTLGVSAADLGSGRLLEGLAEEDGELFKSRGAAVTLGGPADDTGSAAYRDLLADVDRAFADFERAAKTHPWLGNAGLNADAALPRIAAEARGRGQRLGAVDLLEFVVQAVRADSTDPAATRQRPDGIWELKLPPTWIRGLDDIPGYDASARVLRLTGELDVLRDDAGPVGYLGRAHPVVRRALDRVRNIQLESGAQHLDRRVAAARGDGPHPELVYTYLGRVQSGAGRELERVIAVRVARSGAPRAMVDLAEWAALGALDRAVPSGGIWAKHFASWASPESAAAAEVARAAFQAILGNHVAEHEADLAAERASLSTWLRTRAREICGEPARALDLFAEAAPTQPRWKTLTDDTERLAAFATDTANTARQRSETQAVLELHARRAAELDRRARLEPPAVSPLGLLMLVPSAGREGAA
jgi:superfamily II DNA or RNA helicase